MFGCIRVATPKDAKDLAEIYEPVVRATAVSFEIAAPTPWEMEERIERTLATHPWLVFENDDVLGYAYAGPFRSREAYRWSTELSVYVHDGFQGRGIGRALGEYLLDLLARQGFALALGGLTLPNAGSEGLLRSLGFEPVGVLRSVGFKLGRWHDVGWWQRPLAVDPPAPDPPIPFSELRRPSLLPR